MLAGCFCLLTWSLVVAIIIWGAILCWLPGTCRHVVVDWTENAGGHYDLEAMDVPRVCTGSNHGSMALAPCFPYPSAFPRGTSAVGMATMHKCIALACCLYSRPARLSSQQHVFPPLLVVIDTSLLPQAPFSPAVSTAPTIGTAHPCPHTPPGRPISCLKQQTLRMPFWWTTRLLRTGARVCGGALGAAAFRQAARVPECMRGGVPAAGAAG